VGGAWQVKVSRQDSMHVFAGGVPCSILLYESLDGGASWRIIVDVPSLSSDPGIEEIEPHPTDASIVYISTPSKGICRVQTGLPEEPTACPMDWTRYE
jgi:hypothetical protein